MITHTFTGYFSKFFIIVIVAAAAVGCETQPIDSNTAGNTQSVNTAGTPAPPAQPAQPNPATANIPVTLPVLDAMFSDETFANDAKTKLSLTDEQITKLRDGARDAVLKLGEDATDDQARSTRTATDSARKFMQGILGADKTDQFLAFVRERWAGAEQLPDSQKPNSVPTDSRVVVNSPAYRMDVFENGKLVKTYRVGIGYPEFPLPIGLRRASEIIFNPTWTPPDEPWVKGKFQAGKTVEAGSKDNPLGPIKIPIGLPSLIHGGKNPARLGTFASHGCVGLTNAQIQDFALEISALSGTDLAKADIKDFEKQKKETEHVKLANSVPVELRYETIVVEDGKVHIYRDVYERGTNTEDNLRRVLEVYGVSLDQLSAPERDALMTGLEKMAIDATGDPVDTEDSQVNANSSKKNSSKVTRNIKGEKEVIVPVAALAGKGYPAPVEMMGK